MKKPTKFLLFVLALCLLVTPALAASKTVQATLTYRDIKIIVDGEEITPTDVNGASTEPFIIDGTTYLPLRAISEAIGCSVDWDETTNTVQISKNQSSGSTVSADDAIVGISTIGYVDVDGAKISAIAVEYNVDLTGAKVNTSMFQITDYGITQGDDACALGSNPGVATAVYVNDRAERSESGGTGTGNYVIIEVNTDYQLASVMGGAAAYQVSMCAEVTQTGTIQAKDRVVTAGSHPVVNYTAQEITNYGKTTTKNYADVGKFVIHGIEDYELHTLDGSTGYKAFHATHCFDEATGEYSDVDLPYALYVPADYNPNKEYELVLHVHDASAMGDDPLITLTESQGPANYITDEVQQVAKDQGFGGVIVVCPQFNNNIRTARDNWSLSAGVPATWQLMDYITETYNINMDHIYASGQSMGGMQILAMAAQRDNYFAALWPIASQWGSNNSLETPYQGAAYYETPVDGTYVWATDAYGEKCDYRNLYYMLSDDNILITNCADDQLSTNAWREFYLLYQDLTGIEIVKSAWNPLTESETAQTEKVRQLVSQENELGIYWIVHEGGSHGDSWVYAHRIFGCYEWLLTQTRETEMERTKLALNRPFELADTQLKTEDRVMLDASEVEALEESIYYRTGKLGAGTAGYNAALYGRGGQTLEAIPGWDPQDESTYTVSVYVFSFN